MRVQKRKIDFSWTLDLLILVILILVQQFLEPTNWGLFVAEGMFLFAFGQHLAEFIIEIKPNWIKYLRGI